MAEESGGIANGRKFASMGCRREPVEHHRIGDRRPNRPPRKQRGKQKGSEASERSASHGTIQLR